MMTSATTNAVRRVLAVVNQMRHPMAATNGQASVATALVPAATASARTAAVAAAAMSGGTSAASTGSSAAALVSAAGVSASASSASSAAAPFSLTGTRDLGDGLVLRRLALDDYDKGYIQLLGQLTTSGDVTRTQFQQRFRLMESIGCYYTFVIEDTARRAIVASATLVLELKFIRALGRIGHVEDVVVSDAYRGKQLGLRVMEALRSAGDALGCYKLILDCSQDNTKFYAKLGFVQKEVQMALYYGAAPKPSANANANANANATGKPTAPATVAAAGVAASRDH